MYVCIVYITSDHFDSCTLYMNIFWWLMSEVTIASELGVKYGYVGLLHGAYIYSFKSL